ncbi:MAG TPA: peptide ABC transporter substrate-binding protein [Symbiobacteriaceae bacterium]|jgi:oligopeptide transport system substrate-binding protein|nr:peptide ABC transporter substrate-binding protein [Symbiobacteriaceae bacterium]
MRRVLALTLAVAMLAAVGCSKTEPKPTENPGTKEPAKKEQVIRMNIGADPKSLDPNVSTGSPESQVQMALFEGLMRLDKDGKAVPGMAASVETKDDGKTFIFKLRDAKWSNGDPVTAEDFVWTWKRTLNPLLASEYAYQISDYIVGAADMNKVPVNKVDAAGKEILGADGKTQPRDAKEVQADFDKAAANFGAKALDAKTLEVKLNAPTPYFLSLTAFHTLYPVHRKSVEADPEGWFRKPETMVTNGPFKMQSWTPKDKVIAVKNPNYYDAASVKLDKIEFYLIEEETTATTMFESGQLDIIESGVNMTELDRLKKERPDELKILPDVTVYFYRFNVTKKPFDNPKVRQALAMAIDRKSIVDNITKAGEYPAMSIVPKGIPDVSGDFRTNGGDFFKDNDLATAKKLLAEAGYPDGKGFPKVTIQYNTSERHKKVAEAVQEMWKKGLGIDVELANKEWQVYLDDQSNLNYDVSRAGWIGDYIDPMTFIDMWVTKGGNNNTGWSNAKYDELVKTAKGSGDNKVRMQAQHDAEKILMTEMPIAPIYFYVRPILVGKNVEGWSMPLTSPMDLRGASVK